MADNLEVVGLEFDTRDFERQLRRAQRRLDDLEDSLRDTERASRGAESSFRSHAQAVVALIAAYGGFRVIQETGRFVFDTNREFQVLQQRLVSITGSAERASSAFGMITDFARTTPFEVQNLVQAFTTLQAAGIEPTTEMLQGVGNFAAAMGRDITDAVEAILRAAQGGTERLRESFFIPITTEGDNLVIKFRGVEQTVARDSQALIDHFVSIGETQFAGGMARQMGIIDGALSNLQDTAALTASAMGEDTGLNAEFTETIRIVDDLIAAAEPMAVALGSALASIGEQANKAGRHFLSLVDAVNRIREDTPNVGGSGMGTTGPIYGSRTRPGRLPMGPMAPMISDPYAPRGPMIFAPGGGADPGEAGDPAEAARAASRRARMALGNRGRQFVEAQEAEVRALERRRDLALKNRDADIARMETTDRMVNSLREQEIALSRGEEAALRFSLSVQGITGAQQESIVEQWRAVEALEAQEAAANKAAKEAFAELEAEQEQLKRSADRMAEAFTDAFLAMGEGALDLRDTIGEAVDGILEELLRLTIRRAITEPLQDAFLGAMQGGIPNAPAPIPEPSNPVVPVRGLSSGNSVTVNMSPSINISAIDTQTGAQFLQQHKGEIVGTWAEALQESDVLRSMVRG